MAEDEDQQEPRVSGQRPRPFILGGDERSKWRLWQTSFDWYASSVELDRLSARRQVAIFLSCLGPDIIDIYESFELTDQQADDLEAIKSAFADYFDAHDNPAYETFLFNHMLQEDGETINSYVTKIKAQVKKCKFVETGQALLHRLVRDRLISGIRSEPLRTKLLEDKNISLEKAVEICKANEAAIQQNKQISEGASSDINAIQSRRDSDRKKEKFEMCGWCGRKHRPRKCPAFGEKCKSCGKIGHFREVCRSKANARMLGTEEDDYNDGDERIIDALKVFSINIQDCSDYWTEKVCCSGKVIKMSIDTGAQCNVMSKKTALSIGIQSWGMSPIKRLVTYNGDKIIVQGRAMIKCVIRGVKHDFPFQIIDQSCATILDGESAEKAELIKRIMKFTVDNQIYEGLGKLKNFEYDIDIIENPQFVIHQARSIPFRAREAVKAELDNMVELDVIEPCLEATEAVSPLVIVRRDGKIRLCIDLTDVNKNVKRRHFPLRLVEAPVLQYFKVGDPVVLSVDSSSKAFGAVLLQNHLPVAYASRSLTSAEQNYPQIEKEAGAIRFGCQKFHDYIWGAPLTIETDHKPLETIYKKPLVDAPPRLKRILYDIKPYSPTVIYKRGKDIPVADALSRICKPKTASAEETLIDRKEVYAISCLEKSAEERYKDATKNDICFQQLLGYIMGGWPKQEKEIMKNVREYFTFRDQLSEVDGLIFKGEKLLVPESERSRLLKVIHEGHCGIQASIRRAREFVFWPSMTREIHEYVEKCKVCQQTQSTKRKEEVFMKKVPEYPYQVVASDLFHFGGFTFVLLVDSFSGFYEFRKLRETTSEEVIKFLKEKFACFGCPEEFHSDGGPQYSSRSFAKFAKDWEFKHEISSPGFPRANGLADRYVQSAKRLIKKCALSGEDIYHALLMSRNTPKDSLSSAAERLIGRRTRNKLCAAKELVKPKTAELITKKLQLNREKQKRYADRGAKPFVEIPTESRVCVQNSDGSWSTGTIKDKKGNRSYLVHLDDGRELWRNSHFIQRTQVEETIIPQRYVPVLPDNCDGSETIPTRETVNRQEKKIDRGVQPPETSGNLIPSEVAPTPGISSTVQNDGENRFVTRSGRTVKPPVRYGW
ncbi:uncharacterized protein K02A2.6-like [Uranotaenia lowii]|uniref:uncharacterized protein K02A2.6-like n=1 Tax=Uranotaenia lowii TaxID=190385 RepID=UPI00247ACF70|nr:uncharacterized protein K02A2.6-like [Uranotaenia lowii]